VSENSSASSSSYDINFSSDISSLRKTSGAPYLNDRQMMILCMAREGMANKEIAAALGISLASVKRLIHSLLKKLKARDRTHAVITAIRLSIISVESENNDDHI